MHDMLALQKKMFQTWEDNFGAYLTATLRDPAYLSLVGRWWQVGFDWLELSRTCLRPWLRTADVPTNKELAGLYRTVHDLEMRLLELEGRLEEQSEPSVTEGRAER